MSDALNAVAVAPEEDNPLQVAAVTVAASFRVTPTRTNAATTAAANKTARPGVVLLPSPLNRNNARIERYADFSLVRPAAPPAAVTDLAMQAKVSCRFEIRQPRSERHLYQRVPPDAPPKAQLAGDHSYHNADYFTLSEALTAIEDEYSFSLAPTDAPLPMAMRLRYDSMPGLVNAATYPRDAVLAPTGVYRAGLPDVDELYPHRSYREIWLTMIHRDDGFDEIAKDVALFTIAPILFGCDADVPQRLYMARCTGDNENFDIVGEVKRIADGLGIAMTVVGPTGNDLWAQDTVHLGYVRSAAETIHVVVATRRLKTLSSLAGLPNYLIDDDTGFYLDLRNANDPETTLDYGGNLVVTPGVAEATDEIDENLAGPAVPAHPEAPYGKLLLGDGGQGHRRPTRKHWEVLEAQQVQPVVRLDTDWLEVAHVDEMLNFVRTGVGAALLFASPDLFVRIVKRLDLQWEADNARVRRGFRSGPLAFHNYAEDTTLDPYTLVADNEAQPIDRLAHTWAAKLDAIRARLIATTGSTDETIIHVPVLYSPGNDHCRSVIPDMVNLIALGDTVIIPKPWGPRVTIPVARDILVGLEGITGGAFDGAGLDGYTEERFWAKEGMATGAVQAAFAGPGVAVTLVGDHQAALGVIGWQAFPTGWAAIPDGWRLFRITQNTVDLFEAYMVVRLHAAGVTARFVDDWLYHLGDGDLHCGSKVRRQPVDQADTDHWWIRTDYHDVEAEW